MTTVVVFDLDDTLYLERDYVRSGFNAVGDIVRDKYGINDFAERCWNEFLLGARGSTFNTALTESGLKATPETVAALVASYREHIPLLSLQADAEAWLRNYGTVYQLGLITDGPCVCQSRKVQALRVDKFIREIVITDRWGREFWKPHPRAFQLLSHVFGARPEDCVYVGDNPFKDFVAPRELGWRTVRIRRPLGLHADVPSPRESEVDGEIASLSELTTCLNRWFPESSVGPLRRHAA